MKTRNRFTVICPSYGHFEDFATLQEALTDVLSLLEEYNLVEEDVLLYEGKQLSYTSTRTIALNEE